MAERIIRSNILDSDAVNKLTTGGEVFYRRLMSVVDDFGRYDARVQILKANLYPLKLNEISDEDIVKWISECKKAGLISIYEVDGKKYILFHKFRQRLRIIKSKFPAPKEEIEKPVSSPHADVSTLPTEGKGRELNNKAVIFFYIGTKRFDIAPSDYLKENHSEKLNAWQMQNKEIPISEVFKTLDKQRVGEVFTNDNHIYNSFKKTFTDMMTNKNKGQKSDSQQPNYGKVDYSKLKKK